MHKRKKPPPQGLELLARPAMVINQNKQSYNEKPFAPVNEWLFVVLLKKTSSILTISVI